MKKKLVVLTGAGISAESGIPTFRNAVDALWEEYSLEDVCTAGCLKKDPEMVHNFYNMLRKNMELLSQTQLTTLLPNWKKTMMLL